MNEGVKTGVESGAVSCFYECRACGRMTMFRPGLSIDALARRRHRTVLGVQIARGVLHEQAAPDARPNTRPILTMQFADMFRSGTCAIPAECRAAGNTPDCCLTAVCDGVCLGEGRGEKATGYIVTEALAHLGIVPRAERSHLVRVQDPWSEEDEMDIALARRVVLDVVIARAGQTGFSRSEVLDVIERVCARGMRPAFSLTPALRRMEAEGRISRARAAEILQAQMRHISTMTSDLDGTEVVEALAGTSLMPMLVRWRGEYRDLLSEWGVSTG